MSSYQTNQRLPLAEAYEKELLARFGLPPHSSYMVDLRLAGLLGWGLYGKVDANWNGERLLFWTRAFVENPSAYQRGYTSLNGHFSAQSASYEVMLEWFVIVSYFARRHQVSFGAVLSDVELETFQKDRIGVDIAPGWFDGTWLKDNSFDLRTEDLPEAWDVATPWAEAKEAFKASKLSDEKIWLMRAGIDAVKKGHFEAIRESLGGLLIKEGMLRPAEVELLVQRSRSPAPGGQSSTPRDPNPTPPKRSNAAAAWALGLASFATIGLASGLGAK